VDSEAEASSLNGPGCTTTGRVICDSFGGKFSVAWGAAVTVGQATGSPPTPAGGPVVAGTYQLVAETLYGLSPFDVLGPVPASETYALINVKCDIFNEVLGEMTPNGSIAQWSNACGRLVPHALSLVDVAGIFPDSSDPYGDEVAYSATNTTITLISLRPYLDLARLVVAGSYTVVDEFVLADTGVDASVPAAIPEASSPAPQARDPRCPVAAPSPGDACDPNPAPLGCEYGGDAWGRCTTFAICALQPDGSFVFATSEDHSCTANPGTCPGVFGKATEGQDAEVPADADIPLGSTCTNNGISCSYSEGVCTCVPAFTADSGVVLSWNCRARTDVSSADPTAAVCSAQRPLAGDGCHVEGQMCEYDSPCGPAPSLGPSMICLNGYWEYEDGITNCPAEPGLP
jgi:hypothetical protein